jgi:tetratricopeptide (TPR) repeat protein
MKLAAAIILLTGVSFTGLAQTKPVKANAIAAKTLTAADSGTVKQLFFSALREKTIENTKLAAELFNRILQIDPANDAAMFELANLEKSQNNYPVVQNLLERAVTINPNNEWYWIALAGSYEKSNDLDKLENVFNQLIRLDPTKPDYYYDKANALFIQKRYDEALAMYNKVEELAGPSEDLLVNRQKIYIRQGNVKKAISALDELVTANPTQVKYYLMQAEIYNSNNLNDKALVVLQKAKAIDPKNGLIHLALSDIYREKNNIEASYDELEAAFAIPDLDIDQKIRIILGYVPKFPDVNAKASALELSRILTITHPTNSKAFAIYGDMLLQSEKISEAKTAYKKAISLDHQAYNVQEQLVRIDIGENDLDAAIKDGENSLSFFPNQAWMNYMVGVAWQQKREYTKAVSYLRTAAALETQDKDLLSQCFSALGDCYHSLGDNKSSDNAYEKAIAINPEQLCILFVVKERAVRKRGANVKA